MLLLLLLSDRVVVVVVVTVFLKFIFILLFDVRVRTNRGTFLVLGHQKKLSSTMHELLRRSCVDLYCPCIIRV